VVIRGLLGNPIQSNTAIVHLRQFISNDFEVAFLRLVTPPYTSYLIRCLFPPSKVRRKVSLFLATARCDSFNGRWTETESVAFETLFGENTPSAGMRHAGHFHVCYSPVS
jgi:hypothetical protein